MPILDPDLIQPVAKPELMIGLVAAVGTPLKHVVSTLENELSSHDYEVHVLRLSDSLAGLDLHAKAPPPQATEFERVNSLMDRGDELRKVSGGGEALALLAAAEIYERRPEVESSDDPPPFLSGHAFIFNQLKHPDEVFWLRRIYGESFHLVGVYCPESVRKENLVFHYGMSDEQASQLIARDEGEEQEYGQQLRESFHLSDVFVELQGHDQEASRAMGEQIKRYFALLFADLRVGIITPTRDEYGMHLASTASLRSADLSRQVGAAILSNSCEVVSLGVNEVPSAGGGQYWEDDGGSRDFEQGYDSNARMRIRILEELLEVAVDNFHEIPGDERSSVIASLVERLDNARIMNLTEFGRAVHAEMEAILSAGRLGLTVKDCSLFTTTFPCHNCAKHIVGSGVRRVVYIEPYPRSLSKQLHGDAIAFGEDGGGKEKVLFEPFVGVAPRQYQALFSMQTPGGRKLRRKDDRGNRNKRCLGLRQHSSVMTYFDLEAAAALAASRIGQITPARRSDG